MTEHDSVYDGLLGGDDSHWAFGTDFEDPLAGVDTTIADGVDHRALAAYCLMLGDDALVHSHRLSEWCSNAPDLEEDIALANVALDLLGQARLLLARAAAADPDVVPRLPEGSPVPPEDALAFFRDDRDFRNVRLVEVANGDFAVTLVRLLVVATWRLALMERLRASTDPVLAAIAAKAVKELTYHRDYAGRWVVTLAQGTEESRRRLVAALGVVWPLRWELTATHPVEAQAAAEGFGVDPASVADEVDVVLAQVLAAGGVDPPEVKRIGAHGGMTGRHGRHTEALSMLLAEMQVVARAHPTGPVVTTVVEARGARDERRASRPPQRQGDPSVGPEPCEVSRPLPRPSVAARRPPLWEVAARVTDPEMPMLTLADLGVLRSVEEVEDRVVVTITPTYSGCPAMATMRDDLVRSLREAGWDDVEVRVSLTPAWSTDRITERGRRALRDHGISPPGAAPSHDGPVPLTLSPRRRAITCPRCASPAVELVSEFGPTACKAAYRCSGCLEPFEHVKEI